MDFQGRYQILEMLRDGEARTFKARQTSSGRIVLLHQLWVERTPPNQPDLASLVFGFLRRANAEEMKTLVDMGEEESRVFVVTEDLPGCQDLRQWLQSAPGTLPTAGRASMPQATPSADFAPTAATRRLASRAGQEDLPSSGATRLFTTPKAISDQTLPASTGKPAGAPTTHPELHVQPGAFASPDKFAEPLGGPARPDGLAAEEPPMAPPPPASEMGEHGEFTRMFLGSPGASKVRPAAPSSADSRKAELPHLTAPEPPKGKGELGEFGGEFVAPTAEKPSQHKPPAGFEVVFESHKPPTQTPAPPAVEETLPSFPRAPGGEREAPGEFTRLYYGRDELKAAPPSPGPALGKTPLPSLAPDQPLASEGAGEFTRLFQAQSQPKPSGGEPLREQSFQSPPPAPSAVASEGAGEFTRMFKGSPQLAQPAGPPISTGSPASPVPMSRASSQQGPGEFTQMIRGYQPQKSGPTPPVLEAPEPVAPPPPPPPEKAKPGEFTMIFQRPQEATPQPPAAAPPPAAAQTPPPAPQSPEADEFSRMFEQSGGGAGAPPQGARQMPTAAAPQPAAGRAAAAIPTVSVSPPVVPSMPYVQPPVLPQPVLPQPPAYQIPSPQFQPPVVPSPYVVTPQPVMPQMQPMTVPIPMAPQAAPPKAGKNKLLVPLIILGGLFVVAVVVVLVFALKH